MTPRFLLDTDICIFILRGSSQACIERFIAVADQTVLSSVTYAELLFGVERSSRKTENLRTVELFCDRIGILPFDRPAAAHFAEIRTRLRAQGQSIGPYDMMIAGHARSEGLVLVTNNTREFSRIDGLRLENWQVDPEPS